MGENISVKVEFVTVNTAQISIPYCFFPSVSPKEVRCAAPTSKEESKKWPKGLPPSPDQVAGQCESARRLSTRAPYQGAEQSGVGAAAAVERCLAGEPAAASCAEPSHGGAAAVPGLSERPSSGMVLQDTVGLCILCMLVGS